MNRRGPKEEMQGEARGGVWYLIWSLIDLVSCLSRVPQNSHKKGHSPAPTLEKKKAETNHLSRTKNRDQQKISPPTHSAAAGEGVAYL